ncbi:MAG: hypothetical protein WA949_02585 [Phormidesmis sp.]
MKASKHISKGFFLSISALSAVGLLATLPLSASAQTDTTRDDAAAQTSPASPVADEDMMPSSGGSVVNVESDGMTGVTRDDAAAETSPASPVADNEDDSNMMPTTSASPAYSNSPRALW